MKNHFDKHIQVKSEENSIVLSGNLTQATVMTALEQCKQLLPSKGLVTLDLKAIENCDSASLAFLIAIFRESKKRNLEFQIMNMPNQMREISRVSGLEKVLSF